MPICVNNFVKVVDNEAAKMSRSLDQTMGEFSDSMKTRWPLEDILAIDIIAAAERRINDKLKLPTKCEEIDDALWIKADNYSLVFALTFLASRLQDHYEPRELRFRLTCEGKLAYLDLIWAGPAMSSETYLGNGRHADRQRKLAAEPARCHRPSRRRNPGISAKKLPIVPTSALCCRWQRPEVAGETERRQRGAGRPEYYDFDLLAPAIRPSTSTANCPIWPIRFSIPKPRVWSLRMATRSSRSARRALSITACCGRRFLTRSSIRRFPLKPESIPIHGITEDMVLGKPNIDIVLPAFHAFCEDTVLITATPRSTCASCS